MGSSGNDVAFVDEQLRKVKAPLLMCRQKHGVRGDVTFRLRYGVTGELTSVTIEQGPPEMTPEFIQAAVGTVRGMVVFPPSTRPGEMQFVDLGIDSMTNAAQLNAAADAKTRAAVKDADRRKYRKGVFVGCIVLGLIVIGVITAPKEKTDDKSSAEQTSAGVAATAPSHGLPLDEAQFVEQVGAMSEAGTLMKRGRIEVLEYGKNAVRLAYHFHSAKPPHTRAESEVITMGLVTFSIKVLIKHGFNPREHSLFMSAHAYQPAAASVTGGAQVRTYGKALYDYNDDKVEYKSR